MFVLYKIVTGFVDQIAIPPIWPFIFETSINNFTLKDLRPFC
jgi:hypothetical protein